MAVELLNRGKHTLSSSENFFIFGANCSESSLVVQQYVEFLFKEMSEIEKKTFQVNGTEVHPDTNAAGKGLTSVNIGLVKMSEAQSTRLSLW